MVQDTSIHSQKDTGRLERFHGAVLTVTRPCLVTPMINLGLERPGHLRLTIPSSPLYYSSLGPFSKTKVPLEILREAPNGS